ncbi:hypothetical protein EVA_01273 [gut metagenome]|uniref:Uncharacterized protein n=1 Tax=gut metagenome TaxID=749906 RepID=J9H7Z0_9ZZZZ
MTATASSGSVGEYKLGWWDDQLAELKKHEDGTTWLYCKKAGEIEVTVTFSNNENWNEASLERTIYINKVSAVEDVLSDAVQVKAGLRSITLSGMTAGMPIAICAVDGKLISNTVATVATQTLAVAQGGVYIVKVNGKQFKVVVK